MNRQLNIPSGAEQWLINLIELKNRTEISIKQIAEMENLSEKSVSNVFLGKSKNPGVDLIRRIIHALGGSWREIFGESDAVIGSQDLATLQSEVDRLTEENALLVSSLNLANLDLTAQKDKVSALENENKILLLKLEYEEKLLAVHNFYNKLIAKE
jgi:transcriptional regulator with XRE-family HTH domain